ncbi:MAG TPA: HAD hydrolase-like protein [Bryobacteraceae bacterium]|nr:HAD hydrolase-like protein [Bryobacteraceae bacterium]
MSSVRHVIFDLDGTLVDSLPGIAWSVDAALAACGASRRCPDLKALMGPPIRDILAEVSGVSGGAALDHLESAFRASYDSSGWRFTRCQPGAREILGRLSARGLSLSVVTNKPRGATARILRELALDIFFSDVLCRDSRFPLFTSKAEMLIDLFERRDIRASTGLMVGDTLEDCLAAANACLACAIVPHGYGARWDRLPPGCRTVSGWSELEDLCGIAAFPPDLRASEEQHDRS